MNCDPACSERGGIFFFGETGNGKTLIAEAVATELSDKYGNGFIPFFVDYSNLSTKWRGEEAKATANLFRSVRKEVADGKKVMLFLDEFQQTGQRDDTQKCANEVLDQMLVETSRFDYRNCILMAATAQDPSTIEPQLLRPGRFGEKFFFENPTSEEAVDILKKQVELRASASIYKKFVVKEGIDYTGLAEKGEDFTLADWYDLVQDVLKIKVGEIRAGKRFRPLRTEDFFGPITRRKIEKSRTRSREPII